jgi:integrase
VLDATAPACKDEGMKKIRVFTGQHDAIFFANLSPTTVRTMRSVQRSIAEMEIDLETSPENPALWATDLLRQIEKKYPHTGSRNLAVSCARKLLEAAYIGGFLERDYVERAQYVLRARPIRTLPAGRAIPEAEVRGALRAAGVRDRAILAVALGGGLRRAEIASLHTGSLIGGVLRVVGKGGKERDIPLPEPVLGALHRWLSVRPTHRGDTLFLLGERAIYDVFKAYDIKPHDCRRTYITGLLDCDVDVLQVAKLSGHSNIEILSRYDRRGDATRAALVAQHVRVPGL